MRAAARLALAVAAEGELSIDRVPAPDALRPLLGFSRLSAASYRAIAKVIDEDGTFRARVAEVADESVVGRVGWLWLHRPVGWLDEAGTPTAALAGAGGPGVSAKDDKARQAAKDADAARRRAEADAKAVQRELRSLERTLVEQRALAERLEVERAAARRDAKAAEAALAEARRDLKAARSATRDAELELRHLRATLAAVGDGAPDGAPDGVSARGVDPAVLSSAAEALAARARTAGELARSLGELAEALGSTEADRGERSTDAGPSSSRPSPPGGRSASSGARRRRGSARSPSAARATPSLPPGVFGATVEAHRHLLRDAANLVVVDGYNVARTGWSGLSLEEERRRVVAVLEDVQARSSATVVVVFDGDDEVVSPVASRAVRVRYSPAGTTADDVIAELVEATPARQPIVVVSSDRAVAAHARSRGAATMGSAAFLAATRG